MWRKPCWLWHTSFRIDDPGLRDHVIDLGVLEPLQLSLAQKATNESVREQGSWIVGCLCQDPLPGMDILKELVPILKILIQSEEDVDELVHIAWIIRTIARADDNDPIIQLIVDSGIVSHLVPLLVHENVFKQAIPALESILCVENPDLRDHVISLSILGPMLDFLQKPTTSNDDVDLEQNLVTIVGCLCQKPLPAMNIMKEMMPHLKILIGSEDVAVVTHAVWVVQVITRTENNLIIQLLIETGLVSTLISLLSHENEEIVRYALRAIWYVCEQEPMDEKNIRVVVDEGALNYFPALLRHVNSDICEEALVVLSSIASWNEHLIQQMKDAALIKPIIGHLETGELRIQKKAAEVVRYLIAFGNKVHVVHLVVNGVISPLCQLLHDPEEAEDILGALDRILNHCEEDRDALKQVSLMIEDCKGQEKIAGLMHHSELARKIIRRINPFLRNRG